MLFGRGFYILLYTARRVSAGGKDLML